MRQTNRIICYKQKNKIWMLLRNWIPPFSQIYQSLNHFFLPLAFIYITTILYYLKTNFKNKTKKQKQNEFLATNSISMVPVGFVCSIYVITIVSKTKLFLGPPELCLRSKKTRAHLGFWINKWCGTFFSFCFTWIFNKILNGL